MPPPPPPPPTNAAPRPLSILAIFLLLLFCLISASHASPLGRYGHPNNRLLSSCDSSSARGGSLCFRIPRMQRHLPDQALPPPHPREDEIDPRYGVEKRLVLPEESGH
ncbi:hypothetical protein SAY87_001657 [Trapa incisa]|uniref:Uncharacterized protein n=1 Tax=Trapa incisa TaxID=236973 RepID=A0AAN7JT13_9MYRT|nr:hypothetical protein SAY87_001657 [Trapa incisa]